MAINAVHLSYLRSTPILHRCSCSLAKPQRVSCSFCTHVYPSLPSLTRHVQRVHSPEVQKSGSIGSYTHSSEGCPHCFRGTVDLILKCEDAYLELLGKGFWKRFWYKSLLFFLVLFKVVVILLFNQMGSGEILLGFLLLLLFIYIVFWIFSWKSLISFSVNRQPLIL